MSDFSDLKGNWEETRGKLKQIFHTLTDEDLRYVDGNQDELWGKISRKVGKSNAEIHTILAGL